MRGGRSALNRWAAYEGVIRVVAGRLVGRGAGAAVSTQRRIPHERTRAHVAAPRRGEAQSRRCRLLSALVGMPDVTGLKPGHRSTRGLHYTPMVPLGARRGRQPDPLAGGLLARGGSVAA